ncbi:hypothetical protein [Sphingobacterium tabacisoli]|uniref:Lipoprotein n=1 Tax=Sphingobacterium tabacisoli TaxID=2044855 RepID=A0ABW5L2M0_9SPHI|nr:hypothetical protein [Sphingobacterium tabacisoli]
MSRYKSLLLLLSIISVSCNQKEKKQQHETYVYNNGRDTISVALFLTDKTFEGSYRENGPGGFKVTGDISGEVKGDTLLGSLYYTPYKGRDKRRKAIALLKKNNDYIIGKGNSYIYMGVPYFDAETVTFKGQVLKASE